MIDEVLSAALLAAPSCQTLTQVARNTAQAMGLDWSEAKWRGVWKDHPSEAFLVRKKLGQGLTRHIHGQKLHIAGDMRGATVGDAHAPYQDSKSIEVAARVLRWWKPDVLVHNGDNIDCASISRFDSNPSRVYSIPEEVDSWQAGVFIPLKVAVGPKCRQIVLPGNHDLRQEKYLWKHPELLNHAQLHLPVLLGATELGFEYVGYAVVVDNLLEISHGDKAGIHPARSEMMKRGFSISTNTNHVHKADRHEYVPPYGSPIVAQTTPALCCLDPEYMVDPNWSNGLVLWEVRDHKLWMQAVVFNKDYTCTVGDKRFAL